MAKARKKAAPAPPREVAVPRQATEHAAEAAEKRHGGVQHGDDDPALTDEYKARVAAVDVLVPRVTGPDRNRPMCWAWGDHQRAYLATEGP